MHSCCLTYFFGFQKRYILRFATDGAVLSNTKNAVQGAMKLIPANSDGKLLLNDQVPKCYDKEIILYYFIGKVLFRIVMHHRTAPLCPKCTTQPPYQIHRAGGTHQTSLHAS